MAFSTLISDRVYDENPSVWYLDSIIGIVCAMALLGYGIWYVHLFTANTKHLYNICTTSVQRLRSLPNVVQILYKCFVFALGLTG